MNGVKHAADRAPVEISVILATYNHAAYIGRAIDSVLGQVTDRAFELIVSEDASTDSTRAIVEQAVHDDPRIRLIVSPVNLRSNEVIARGLRAARGQYVCLLDGDDHWIVDDKIERQAALLDADTSASACFHNALVVHGRQTEPSSRRWTPSTQAPRVHAGDIWRGNPFATSAGMMRRAALDRLGDWYAHMFPITDWPLYVLCSEHGDLVFRNEPVAAYRLHDEGLFSALPGHTKLAMTSHFYRSMDKATHGRMHADARTGSTLYFLELAEAFVETGDGVSARACLWHALRAGGIIRARALLSRWRWAAARSLR